MKTIEYARCLLAFLAEHDGKWITPVHEEAIRNIRGCHHQPPLPIFFVLFIILSLYKYEVLHAWRRWVPILFWGIQSLFSAVFFWSLRFVIFCVRECILVTSERGGPRSSVVRSCHIFAGLG